MIILEPFGGLANRMRVIESALNLMEEKHKEIKLIWNLSSELNCNFNDLFQPIQRIKISSKKAKYKYIIRTNQKTFLRRLLASFINNLLGVGYAIKENDFPLLIWKNKLSIERVFANNKKIYIHTCQEFGRNLNSYCEFRATPALQKKIDAQIVKFDEHTIGLHIRRGDHIESIDESPIELFIEKIKSEISNNVKVKFYLSTDDLKTEKEIIGLFKSHIITRPKNLNRNSDSGIKDALVDLYCLSSTTFIYGSFRSSFSDLSASIGNINIITLKK
jgi:hypothetical protein